MTVNIRNEDCVSGLATLAPGSIDAIVTDPPYELTSMRRRFGKANAKPAKGAAFQRHNAGFMGKEWDGTGIAFDVDFWRAAFDVMKPGAHLVAFGATRTYHRMACAIEDAGFEIRDTLMWLYGTGFPKSSDVARTIDRQRDDDVRPICRAIRAAMDREGVTSTMLASYFGVTPRMVDHWAARETNSQPTCPKWGQWVTLRAVLLSLDNTLDDEVARLNGRKGTAGEAWDQREKIGERVAPDTTKLRAGFTGAAFNDAEALGASRVIPLTRPASEAARQWEGWGTALKPAVEPIVLARKPISERNVGANVVKYGTGALNIEASRIGQNRWPANLLLDEAAADDMGAASRYFYHAKASTAERNRGLSGPNPHPTVKPIALMEWLIRLVTPPGGTIVDPFLGSGSTAIAARNLGVSCVGFEREAEYCDVAAARLAA